MVNRVVLCGILTEAPRKPDGNPDTVAVSIKSIKYGTYYTIIRGTAWRNSAKWIMEKNLKGGDAVQIVGSLSTTRDGLSLSVDSLQKIDWLTEAYIKHPWPKEEPKDGTKKK